MSLMDTTKAACLLVAASAALPVNGGDRPPTLQEVVESAYQLSPQRQALAAHAGEADALAARAGSLIADNPSLDATYKTDQVGSDDGFREWEAGLSLPMWKPGQKRAAAGVADRTAVRVERKTAALRLAVAAEVRERLWNAVLMKNNLDLATHEQETARELVDSVRRRVELGELARTDLLLAQDTALTKQGDLLRAQKDFRNAMQRYQIYTGEERLPRRRGEARSPLSTVSDEHPALADAMAAVAEAAARVAEARRRGGGAPELFVGGNGERGDSDEDFNSRLGLSVNIPIGTAAHIRPVLAAAERVRADARAEYGRRRRALTTGLSEAAQILASAQAELDLAGEQNRLATESLRLAQVAFDAGETNLLDLLRVQALAFAAERREKELKITRQRAIARYNQSVGVLP